MNKILMLMIMGIGAVINGGILFLISPFLQSVWTVATLHTPQGWGFVNYIGWGELGMYAILCLLFIQQLLVMVGIAKT